MREKSTNSSASFARLRRLREQVEFLASSPPDVRHSLSLWHDLHEGERERGGGEDGEGPPTAGGSVLLSSEALAFERGALLLPSAARPPEGLELGGISSSSFSSDGDDDEDGGDDDGDEEETISAERVSAALDDAALA